MLTDYVQGTSLTFNKNTNYWGHDERHPQNQLPYADTMQLLIIPDNATAIAALRTGKIDFMENIDWQQATSLKKTNPELHLFAMPAGGPAIDYRVDKAPFTDINVRKALEMSIDRQAIAQNFYGGTVDGTPAGLISTQFKGYYYPYADWPQDLKDEYSYNPTKAKDLLAAAGYPQGFKTNVVTAANNDLQLLQVIKSYFMDIGVDMTINVMDPPAYHSFVVAKKQDQMSYDAMSQTATTRPPNNVIYYRYSKEKEMNCCNVQDPGYDALVTKFESAATEADLAQASREADKYDIENHWSLYIFPIVTYDASSAWLGGYIGDAVAAGGGGSWGMYFARWWVDQNLKKSMGH
jgi:peptide/nickel transport system substrate-binding protein